MRSALVFNRTLALAAAAGIISAFAAGGASAAVTANLVAAATPSPAPAPAAGTVIVNQASGTYDDGVGATPQKYYTTSNTVSVTVQNAPGLTISATGGSTVTSGNTVTDTFVFTNVGNGNANVQIASESLTLPAGSTATPPYSYTVLDSSGNPVSGEANLNQAAFNALGGGNGLPMMPGQQTTIKVSYPVPYGSQTSLTGTATAGLTATISQAAQAQSGTASQVLAQSMSQSGSASDTIVRDAQLKLYTAITPGTTQKGTNGVYVLETDGVNSGGLPARGSQDAYTFLGGTSGISGIANNGVFVAQQVPVCDNCTKAQSQLAQPSTFQALGNGYAASAVNLPVIVYGHGTAGNPLTWNTTWTGNDVVYVGAYINCDPSNNICLNGTAAATNKSDGGGTGRPVTNPAFSIISTLSYPTGFHSSDPGAFHSISNGVLDGNVQNAGNQYVLLGPTLKDPATNSATFDTGNQTLTAELYNAVDTQAVTGASNIVTGSAPASFGVLVGPLNQPAATGILDATQLPATADTNGDFTAFVLFASTTNGLAQSVNTNADPKAVSTFSFGNGAPTSYQVENTIQNIGTTADTFELGSTLGASANPSISVPGAIALPTGWTVTFYGANASNQPDTAAGPITVTPSVLSGATYNFFTVYSPPANATLNQFVPYAAYITATSHNSKTSGGSGGTAVAQTDQTWHVMFVNGFVQMQKNVASDGAGCYTQSSGATALSQLGVPNVCPGSTLTYTVNYKNLAPDPTLGSGTNNLSLTANNFLITDDGTTAPNNWATFSTGLLTGNSTYGTGSASDTLGGGFDANHPGIFGSRWNGTNTPGSKKLEDHVGTLTPQTNGVLTYSITLGGGNLPSPAPSSTPTPTPPPVR